MNRIKSFSIDHDNLEIGVYISRVDGDITTFDLRFVKPNTPPYLSTKAMHTIEHLFATYSRNSRYSNNIVYFGPMGCRTGFYFLTRALDNETALNLIKDTLKKCCDHTGEIPGAKKKECGNYKEHDLCGAKLELIKYYDVIEHTTANMLNYD